MSHNKNAWKLLECEHVLSQLLWWFAFVYEKKMTWSKIILKNQISTQSIKILFPDLIATEIMQNKFNNLSNSFGYKIKLILLIYL